MPLDVQPLSPLRRALMVLLMFALLGAALGFAEFLVQRQERPSVVIVGFSQPAGAIKPLEINDDLQDALGGPISECFVQTDSGPRRYVAFSLVGPDEDIAPTDYLDALFARTAGDDSETLPAPTKTTLGGQPAIQIEKISAPRPGPEPGEQTSTFAIMRLAVVGQHIVAICFSGIAPLAESDRQSFATYCDQGVHITLVHPGQSLRRN